MNRKIQFGRVFSGVATALLTLGGAVTPQARCAAAEWRNISADVVKQLESEGKKQRDFKHSGGIAVDSKTGNVFLVMCGQGLWKSTDQGKSFTRIDTDAVGGRGETGGAIQVDPAGGRLAFFMVYGPSGMTTDSGRSFSKYAANHFDYGAVDWEATGKAMIAFRHESGETITLSRDGGATWHDLGKGFDGFFVGMFDAQTLLAGKKGELLRSTDGGSKWEKVSDAKVTSPVVQVRDGIGYLLSDQGLLVSRDKGATWTQQGSSVKGAIGPIFGKEKGHLFVVGEQGVMETKDAGKTWEKIASMPPDYRIAPLGRGPTPSVAFDAENDILYMSRLGMPAYKLQR